MVGAKTVLVTGYAGFIGSAISYRYAKAGFNVYGIGNGEPGPNAPARSGLQGWKQGEICRDLLQSIELKPDIIIHCAGGSSVSESIENQAADYRRTVGSTQALASWIVRNAPNARIVYTSSGAVYGESAGAPDDRGSPVVPVSPYGRHKRQAEDILLRSAEQDGLNVAIVRLFSIYGQGLRKQIVWDACCKLINHRADFFGTGLEKRDFVEVTDVAELLLLAAEVADNKAPIMDGGSGQGTTIAGLVELIAENLSPGSVVRFTGSARAGDPDSMLANPHAANAIGWSPTIALDDGIARYCSWFIRNIVPAR